MTDTLHHTRPAFAPVPDEEFRNAVQQETRFAVVLYGGVSLAVYISGVCQELLNMNRATAFNRAGDAPAPEELAYRLASTLVSGDRADGPGADALATVESILDEYESTATSSDDTRVAALRARTSTLRPRRRFVVDILTGSSAGGLNAVYLAKALTHDQSIDHLTKLWVEQGGFENILNDLAAAAEHDEMISDHLTVDIPETRSLLSGDLMALKLYNALTEMDRGSPAKPGLVDALDCYLTTTDLRGLVFPVRLSDGRSVLEPRHRCVFHLAYGTTLTSGGHLDQFSEDWNRHLAFMARATSAHPAAFEPAQIKQYAGLLPGAIANFVPSPDVSADGILSRRIAPRLLYAPWSDHMPRRWYSDGGDMDNKPFSYVLHPLRNRRAEVPVDRQLLFVEPDPADHRADHVAAETRPTFAETTVGAFNLGRTENIREDIEHVLDRNKTIKRLKRGFDDQVGVLATRPPESVRDAAQRRRNWQRATYGELVAQSEIDLAYEFHKTMWLGGEIGETMATVAGFANDSAQSRWVTDMTQQYAQRRFVPPRLGDVLDRPADHRRFLLSVDLGYRLRRLMFVDKVLRRLQEELQGGDLAALCGKWQLVEREIDIDTLRLARRRLNEVDVDLRCIGRHLRAGTSERAFADRLPDWERDPEWRTRWGDDGTTAADESMQFAMAATRLNSWLDDFDRWRERLATLGERDSVRDDEPGPTSDEMDLLDAMIEEVGAVLRPWLIAASTKAELAIEETLTDRPRLRELVAAVYAEYHQFDHFVLPSWGEARGELAEAEVTRVSPLDATRLLHVSKVPGHEINKLAGNSLAHFGGFLDKDWRRNDIMWGRLDAAEILISRLLPSEQHRQLRDRLIDLAHDRILVAEWHSVRALPDLTAGEPLNELPAEGAPPDPGAARTFIQNDLNVSLDTRGRVKPQMMGRTLEVLGGLARHHAIDEPERKGTGKSLGRVIALMVRILRLGFPARARRSGGFFIFLQRIVYFAMAVAAVAAIAWSFVAINWKPSLVALIACVIPLAGFLKTFLDADLRQSWTRNMFTLLFLLVPVGLFVWALNWNPEATFAVVAGFGALLVVSLLSGPSIFVRWKVGRLLEARDDTSVRPPDQERTVDTSCTRQELFALLTDPERLFEGCGAVRFLRGERTVVVGDELEVRTESVDGTERRAVSYRFTAVEVVPDRRLVVEWGIVGDQLLPPGSALLSVHLREWGAGGPTGTRAEILATYPKRCRIDAELAERWPDQLVTVLEAAPATTG